MAKNHIDNFLRRAATLTCAMRQFFRNRVRISTGASHQVADDSLLVCYDVYSLCSSSLLPLLIILENLFPS